MGIQRILTSWLVIACSILAFAAGCQTAGDAGAASPTRTGSQTTARPPATQPAQIARANAAAAAAAPSSTRPPRVYVSNERSNNISIVDSGTGQVVQTIPVGKRPRGIHVSRDGARVFVALSGSPIGGPNVKDEDLPPADKKADGIAVVDATTGRFLEKIASGSDPEQFSLTSDERFLYVSNEDEGQASVVDLPAKAVVATIKVGIEPEGVATTPDGSRVYVTSETTSEVHVIDTTTRAVVGHFQTAQRPRGVAFLPDGSKAYVTCETGGIIDVVDPQSFKVTKEIKPEGQNVRPMGIVISPDGRRAYVTTGRGGTVVAIDTATDEVTRIIPSVGARPWGIGITPDGQTLYTANGPSNDVSVIDVTTLTIKGRIKAGESPWGIAISK
jgi:YVTN family beta-propeller protein